MSKIRAEAPTTEYKCSEASFPMEKVRTLMLLLQSDTENAAVEEMITRAKKNYVLKHHKLAISHMTNASGYKKNKWKTYITVDGKRKEILKKTENELYEWLFHYYDEMDHRPRTLNDIFELYMTYKQDCLGRCSHTIEEDRRMFKHIDLSLQNMPLLEITDEDVQKWLVKNYMKCNPTETALRKHFQLLNQLFEYGIRKKICFDNPMRYLSIRDYLKDCNHSRKRNEEKAFSEEELELITRDALKDPQNPRALMTLLAKETGLRAGELTAIHKEDIQDGFLHIHRQQRREKTDGPQFFFELEYTKEERMHPHDGRFVPITSEGQKAIDLALALPGESEYLFHDNGKMISKDSYLQNLKRRCRRLGIKTTNNHAFRIAFNSRMIELGFSASDRALILGHEVQTNETHYSLTDKRRLEGILERLDKEKEATL